MPRNGQPASKAGTLVQRLAALADQAILDEFEMRRLEREAQALMRADPAGAHTLLGGLAALRGKGDDSRHHHRNALAIGDSFETRYNFCVSLSLLDEPEDAFEIASELVEKFRDHLEVLEQAIKLALECAHFRRASELCSRWETLAPDRPNSWSESTRHLSAAVDSGTFQEGSVREVLRVLNAVQRAEGVRTSSTRVMAVGADGHSFLYERSVRATPPTASAMNERFADRIVQQPDLLVDPGTKFVAAFVGTGPDARHA